MLASFQLPNGIALCIRWRMFANRNESEDLGNGSSNVKGLQELT